MKHHNSCANDMAKRSKEVILITGGAGFMGSCFTNMMVTKLPDTQFIIVDALTGVADKHNIEVWDRPNFSFEICDIRDAAALDHIFAAVKPTHVVHFAAETHVDVSIRNPLLFLETNVIGTHNVASASRAHNVERVLHISTDEVYGALTAQARPFTEKDAFRPNSPYSASKASAEHIMRAFRETYGLPVVIARSSNNYGPRQDATKFIPVCINRLLKGEQIPLYGKGTNVRDWIYVEDSAAAFETILRKGALGEAYNVGASGELKNIDVVKKLLKLTKSPPSRISYVADRPGHDYRYALSSAKLRRLGWKPHTPFAIGLQKTLEWYSRPTRDR